jgi:hypothetical protein
MHRRLAVVLDRQEAEELARVVVYSAVDYPLQADHLRQNFHLSHRRLPRAALREI